MKSNGMRAWRKANKATRRRVAKENRLAGFSDRPGRSGRYARRHWLDVPGHNAILTQRPVIEPRPFTPRSLVGMSESAKKRAARRCPGCMECKNEVPQRDYGLRCNSGGVFAKSPEQGRRGCMVA